MPPSSGFFAAPWRLGRSPLSLVVTAALAIVVVLLAGGMVYLLASRREQPLEQPDLGPAIQEATSHVASQVVADLLRVNEESRKLDAKTAEAALEKRQTEIKNLTERIARGQERIEKQVQARGETDGQTRALLEQ